MNFSNLNQYLDYIESEYAQDIALSKLVKDEFIEITYKDFIKLSRKFARLLKAQGFKKNSKVMYLAKHDVSWPIYAFGVFLAGGTLIPIDMLLSKEEISLLIKESKPDLIMMSNEALKLVEINDLLSYKVFYTDLDELEEAIDQRHITLDTINNEDLALIVYTSGTTGNSKGVMIHFGAIIFQLNSMKELFDDSLVKRTLSVLPINHMYEFTVGLCTQLMFGVEIVIANNLEKEQILYCLNKKKVHQIVGVPIILKSLKATIDREISKKSYFDQLAITLAFFISKYIKNINIKRKVFKTIHNKFGGEFIQFAVGGSKCPDDIKYFFDLIGLPVYEGYGLTETAPIIATNTPLAQRSGSVGKVLANLEVKTINNSEEGIGEIIVKGESVFKGYFDNESESIKCLKDEWFYTGDLGRIDHDGHLYITGRVKNLIVLENGKKIYPEEIESKLNLIEDVSDSFICAVERDGRQEIIAALIPTFDEQVVEKKVILEKAEKAYKKIAHYKRPSHTLILDEDLPRTSSRKIKISIAKKMIIEILK